ncbi:MAG: ABC transporter permease [Clostridia bacterium]|nr:ABC transporter permease [Clostridia bacterium]
MKKFFQNSYLGIILCFLYAPIMLVILFSFFNTADFSFANGFSFESYSQIFTSEKSEALLDALKNTLLIAAISSVIATVLGTVASIGMHYLPRRAKRLVEGVNQLPVINSEVVMAVSFMVFFVTFAFPEGYLRLIIAHVAFCTPYVVLAVMPKLAQMDSNIYEAALDLGASPAKAMVKVLLPYLAPAILSGFIMAFTISLDDFIITQINKGASTGIDTLSTLIYSDARVQGLEPFWFAVFSIIFVVVLAVLLFVNLKKSTKKEEKNI